MATVDMTQRKLNFPPRFLPYLEKHRIFELLHECVELLVQVKPKDHITFLKNVLPCAATKRDKQRVVFLSPPHFDRVTFSELLADCLGIQCMNKTLLGVITAERWEAERVKIETLSESVEEESCIYLGEDPPEGKIIPQGLFYSPEAETLYAFSETVTEEEPEEKLCVCPCVKKEEEEKKEKEEEEQEVAEEEEKGEDYPCEPYLRKRKKFKPKAGRKPFSPQGSSLDVKSSETTEPRIDFGILAECEQSAKGWILEDFPMSGEEAEELNTLGVIPTHALRIIIDEEEEEKDLEYKVVVKGWMKAYKFVPVLVNNSTCDHICFHWVQPVWEIRKKRRGIIELIRDMCRLLSVMPHRHAPMLPRVVLIGSRGSGVTTQGEKLARKYGMVHVEFEMVISRALQQDDEMCKMYKLQLATRPDPELEALLLERALLTSMCRNRGWVLTGYPRNIDQMRMLDIIATPPNRVIFIEVPARECFVRLYYRKIDSCLGDEYKLPRIEPFGVDSYEMPDLDPELAARLLPHPKNNKKQIIHDIEQHFINKKDMMAYCGETASYVDGNQEIDRVFELIEQIVINPAPARPPRDPLAISHGIQESYERLKKFRLAPGMFFNNMVLNPPKQVNFHSDH